MPLSEAVSRFAPAVPVGGLRGLDGDGQHGVSWLAVARRFLVSCLLVCAGLAGPASAQPAGDAVPTLDMLAGQTYRQIAPFAKVHFAEGSPMQALPAVASLPVSSFRAVPGRYLDFGFRQETIWLRFDLHHVGDQEAPWVLDFNVRFMTEIVAFHARASGGELLLNQGPASTFADRPVPDRLLRVPIRLRADERSVLYIGYRSTGGTALPLAFETPETAESRRSVGNMAAAAAYAAIAFMIAFGLLQFLALGQPVQLGYATYLAAVLFYLVHMDGWTFQWLWPESPRWNDFAAVPLGLAMSVTALAFSHALLDVAAMSTRLSRVFKAAMALAVGMALVAPLGQPAWFKSAAYGVTLLGAVLCAAAGLLAWRRRVPAVRFYVIGWVGVAAGVALTALASNLPALVPKEMADLLPKLTIVFDALMFSMALADRASALRRERDQTAQRELAALRLQHETAERLHATERERLEAQLLAQAKARQLATASHDIRQPLASLKLTLAALGDRGEISAHVQERFSHSIDYLEQLAREYTAAGAPTAGGGAHAAHGEAAAPGPGFALDMLIDNLALMFRAEAEGKGLALDARRTRATAGVQVRGDAMAAMRVAGNLVANAIRYTEAGRVLITARCRGDRVVMGVHDTGPGIAAGELAQLFDEGRRGAAAEGTEGSGLGLSIASRLAEREGFGLRVRSRVGRGSCFQVEMPRRVFVARGEDRRRRRP